VKKIIFIIFLNIAGSCLSAFSLKNPLYLLILLVNILVVIRTRWSRVFLLVLLYLGLIFILLGLAYSLIRINEINKLLMISGSLFFVGGYSIYSLFTFSSKNIKTIYQKKVFQDEYGTPSWICPKCSNKMVFSIACWNCGFKKEDLNKPMQTLKSEDDKLDASLHKKNETGHA